MITPDNNERPCSSVTSALDAARDSYHQLHQVRHGQIARYPHDRMQALLKPRPKLPWWRRLLRWLKRIN